MTYDAPSTSGRGGRLTSPLAPGVSPPRALCSFSGRSLTGKPIVVPSVCISYLIQASFFSPRAITGAKDGETAGGVLVGLFWPREVGGLFRGHLVSSGWNAGNWFLGRRTHRAFFSVLWAGAWDGDGGRGEVARGAETSQCGRWSPILDFDYDRRGAPGRRR